jgi:L-fuconolactonase
MRIDAHQHFWRYKRDEYGWIDDSMRALRRDFFPDNLRPEIERAGFDGSIAVQTRQNLEETRWLLQLAERNPTILGVIGWVDLRSPNVRSELAEFAENPKLLGVRHIVQSEPDQRFLLQPEFLRGVSALAGFELTYDILIYPRHLSAAAEFVERFPEQRFVLDHMAKPPIRSRQLQPWESDLRALAKFRNVVCKISGLVTEAEWSSWKAEDIIPYLDVAFDAFGADRLIFGSDWPVCTVAASYTQVVELVQNYLSGFSIEVRDAVFGGNAERFWKLGARERDIVARGRDRVATGGRSGRT